MIRQTSEIDQIDNSEGSAALKHEPHGNLPPCADDIDDRALDEKKIQIISFFLNGTEYALEVSEAVEVLKPRQATEIPRTPNFIKGIVSVRGEMIPVMDLKNRLGIEAAETKTGRILVAAIEDLKAGFIIDKLSGVKEIPLRHVKYLDGEAAKDFFKGIIHIDNKIIHLLNTVNIIDINAMP